jgi:hypothetical protein
MGAAGVRLSDMEGRGRSCSKTLPPDALGRATDLAKGLIVKPSALFGPPGRRCQVLGPAANGGVRISGEAGSFAERTVSLTDLGWAILAADDARTAGAVLDEARVNRLRYIEGTPKASTRWMDTKWALLLAEGQ